MNNNSPPKDEYARIETWFAGYIDAFRDPGGALPVPLELKRVHSLAVADNSRLIAAGLGLGAAEAGLAHAAGLLHDIGRFNQYARYASFNDSRSLDHGLESRRVLEEKAASLFASPASFRRLLCAVQYHNRKVEDLPSDLSPAENSLLRLVRDADKISILEMLLDSIEKDGFRIMREIIPEIKMTAELTPAVLETVARRGPLAMKSLVTMADVMVMAAYWFYDLNYAPARRLAAERGFLDRIRKQLPENPVLTELFSALTKAVSQPGPQYIEG